VDGVESGMVFVLQFFLSVHRYSSFLEYRGASPNQQLRYDRFPSRSLDEMVNSP
jgi:hypothetical protein